MSAGFVYLIINPSMPGLVKIGQSTRSSKQRAREGKGTWVPDNFEVVYDELVTDCRQVEILMKQRYLDYQYKPNREFFQLPIREAIRGLMEEALNFRVPQVGSNSGVEILPDLKRKYPTYLDPAFLSIKIVHRDNIVYLESVRFRHTTSRDEIVERTDLAFISDGEIDMFIANRSPEDNARLFVHELDEYSMIHCTDLFTQQACSYIAETHEKSRCLS